MVNKEHYVKKPATFIVCQKHGVLHHWYGCVVCNEALEYQRTGMQR